MSLNFMSLIGRVGWVLDTNMYDVTLFTFFFKSSLSNLIFFLFPKYLELFSTPKNAHPKHRNSKMSLKIIFFETQTLGLKDL